MDAKSFDQLEPAAAKLWVTLYTTKIQAIWRGYRSRKGKTIPCCDCGYEMTLSVGRYPDGMSPDPCSWCQDKKAAKECAPCDCLECKMGKVMWCPGCGSDECDGRCDDPCDTCNSYKCSGRCEPYISCSMCGANCYDGDYPTWRFCSRRCMVDAGRD